MDPDEVTVGAHVALVDGAVGVVIAIASDDDARAVSADGPVRVRLLDGQLIHVTYEQITDTV